MRFRFTPSNLLEQRYDDMESFFMYLEKNEGQFKVADSFNHTEYYLKIPIENANDFIEKFSKCNFNGNFLNFKWDKNFSSGEKALLNMFACFNFLRNSSSKQS